MANFEIPENPEFSSELRKFETSDAAHADVFNSVIKRLLENEIYNNTKINEHEKDSYIHVTSEEKYNWNNKTDVYINTSYQGNGKCSIEPTSCDLEDYDMQYSAMLIKHGEKYNKQTFLIFCITLKITSSFDSGLRIVGEIRDLFNLDLTGSILVPSTSIFEARTINLDASLKMDGEKVVLAVDNKGSSSTDEIIQLMGMTKVQIV